MYVASYMLKPSTNVILLDHTLRLTLWNSFYYKRCLYQTILNVSVSGCHNRFGSCAEVLIVPFILYFIKFYCIAFDVRRCLFSQLCKQCVWVAYYLRDQYVRAYSTVANCNL